jgi:Uma2 family endonuclease
MSIASPRPAVPAVDGVPLLVNGDRMKQPEFHRRYEAYPGKERFELVGGIVYMTLPLRWTHGTYHTQLGVVLGLYDAGTPGVEAGDNATLILGEESEPQPDLALRILPECGGQSTVEADEYVRGAPELVAEVAYSSRAIDLNQKLQDYRKAGVREYLVLSIEERRVHWFRFPSDEEIRPNRQGVLRSVVFPGLWVHERALIDRDSPRLVEALQEGLASRPHAAFVRRLSAARRRNP